MTDMVHGPESGWDVFISYAREDAEWVRGVLLPALEKRRTADGQRPVIFLDTTADGIPPAVDWLAYLATAVERSRYFVAVYSPHYFRKPMCYREVSWALQLHPQDGRLVPVLLDPAAAGEVPFMLSHINWLAVNSTDWFDRLCRQLELVADQRRPALRTSGVPDSAEVNRTFRELVVEIVDECTGERMSTADPVTVHVDPPTTQLQGTLTVAAENGVVAFRDLVCAAAGDRVRLIFDSPGCAPVASDPFTVVESAVEAPRATGSVLVLAGGRPIFFPDNRSLATVDAAGVSVFSAEGEHLGKADFAGPLRLWARGTSCLAVANWSGQVVLVRPDGTSATFDLAGRSRRLCVPGACCFAGDRLYVGMWNGAVWALTPDSVEPELVLRHNAGVQSLAIDGDHLVLVDLDGRLVRHSLSGGHVASGGEDRLESVILGVREFPDGIIAVGERRCYRYTAHPPKLVRLRLPMSEIESAVLQGAQVIVTGSDGQGLRLNSQLAVSSGFRAGKGTKPIDVDRSGQVIVLACQDGSSVLVVHDRVVFANPAGPMAVSPDGTRIAFAHLEGTRVAEVDEVGC